MDITEGGTGEADEADDKGGSSSSSSSSGMRAASDKEGEAASRMDPGSRRSSDDSFIKGVVERASKSKSGLLSSVADALRACVTSLGGGVVASGARASWASKRQRERGPPAPGCHLTGLPCHYRRHHRRHPGQWDHHRPRRDGQGWAIQQAVRGALPMGARLASRVMPPVPLCPRSLLIGGTGSSMSGGGRS